MADFEKPPSTAFDYSRLFGSSFTGQAANLRAQIIDGPSGAIAPGYPISGFVESGATGLYSIILTAPAAAGDWLIEITNAAGTTVYASDSLTVLYSAAASGTPQPGDLFTVQDLKNHLRSIKATDPSKDDELQMLVTSVSDAAAQYTNHRWALETAVSKTFRFDDSDGFLDMNPWDLRAQPTSVQIDTDISPVTLDVSQYRKEPRNAPHGIYTHLDLWLGVGARNTNFWADAQPGWSGREVQVLGNWGWPSIPSSLRLSAIAFAAELFTNPTSAARVSKADSSKDFGGGQAGEFTVPDAILALWAPFRRIEF